MSSIGRLAVFAALTAVAGFAQSSGRILGSVIDPTGAAIPNATVSLLLSGGVKPILVGQTTSEGSFTLNAIRPDTYNLKIEATGFTTTTVGGISVDPAKDTSLPPTRLALAASSQTVDVQETSIGVQTQSTDITSTLTQAQIQNLPVLDRQISTLFITQAGVSGNRTSTSINGLRPSYTNVTLDGVDVQDSVRTNDLDFIPNRLTIGQVAEMSVSTSNLDPTVGGNATNIALSTPSGTNQYHGNAYWYNRNSYFAANNWFSNRSGLARPFLNLNQIGGTVGGPIIKDKLLFFANYEAYRKKQQTRVTDTILTPTARQGILQYRVNGAVQQYNVLGAAGLSIDPAIQSMIAQMPAAGNNVGVGDGLNTTGYTFNARNNDVRDTVFGKLDYYLSTKHSFSGAMNWNRDNQDRPDQGTFYTPVGPISNTNRSQFLSAAWRWSPTPSITNELRGGFDRQTLPFVYTGTQPPFYLTGLDFTAAASQPSPENRKNNTYAIQDNATWTKGRHSMAFGFQSSIYKVSDELFVSVVPSYGVGYAPDSPYGFPKLGPIPGAASSDITIANNLLASLAGIISTGTQSFNPTSRTSGFVPGAPQVLAQGLNNFAPYFRDTWKMRRNLTLTLGLRWEYFGPVDISNGLLVEPKVANNNGPATLLSNATLDFVPQQLNKRDLNNFGPSVGTAWNIFGDGRLVLRAGYSVAFANDNNINDVYNTITNNNGLSSTINLANLNVIASKNLPKIPVPAFMLPTTSLANYNLTPASPPVESLVDPNLATPYVQQWNLAIASNVKGFALEGRYVGNHAVKLFRNIDYNQVNVQQGTFVQDFISARNNGFLALAATNTFNPTYNPNIAGSKPLPFFNSLPNGGSLTSTNVSSSIRTGEIGSLAQTYQSIFAFPSNIPNFSYFPNPLLLYGQMMTNLSNSTYDGLQLEVRKRTSSGIDVEASYTFSKSLSDALAVRSIEAQLDNKNPGVEKARTPFDTTNAFKLLHSVPLPFGPGHRFNPHNGILNRVLGGWSLNGFLRIESGPPVAILSARGTLNRGARSTNNTVDTPLNLSQIKALTGTFDTGSKLYYINPSAIGTNGQGVAPDGSAPFSGQAFYNPQPGSLGSLQRRLLDGPAFWMYDSSLIKETKIFERHILRFQVEAYNLFNHPNFFVGDQNINTSTFGQITSMNTTNYGVNTRLVEFSLMYKF